MKYLCFLLLTALPFAFYGCGQNQPKSAIAPERLTRIDTLMEKAIADEVIPSGIVYIWQNGEVVYFKPFGYADREKRRPMSKDAIFRNASQTKLVTTVALMTLYEQGLFILDEPVKKYLPEFSHPVVAEYDAQGNMTTRPAKGNITIRQLLSHSSGISYDTYGKPLEVIRYEEPIPTEEAVGLIAQLPLRHDPGRGFSYGFGIDVAGRLAEVLSGMRLDSLIRQRVLEPLEMTSTYFYLPPKEHDRLVPMYRHPDPDGSVVLADSVDLCYPLTRNAVYFGGGAGLSGTIGDYAHLCEMILNKGVYKGRRILSEKTVEQMCSDQLFGAAGSYEFGLGLEIATPETFARRMVSPGALGWGGAYGTKYMIDPKENLLILFYTNQVDWRNREWTNIWDYLLAAVYQSL